MSRWRPLGTNLCLLGLSGFGKLFDNSPFYQRCPHDTTVILPYSYTNGDKNTLQVNMNWLLTINIYRNILWCSVRGCFKCRAISNYNAKNGKLLSLNCVMSHPAFIPTWDPQQWVKPERETCSVVVFNLQWHTGTWPGLREWQSQEGIPLGDLTVDS